MFGPDVSFANPEYLYLLLVVPLMVGWYLKFHRRMIPAIRYSTLDPFRDVKPTWRERSRHLPVMLRVLTLAVLIVALARPQTSSSGEDVYTEGIDIALVLDISGSMLAEDLKPNRIEAAKQVAAEFVDGRPNDRIGLVVFAGESFTQCPMTLDHRIVKEQLRNIKSGMVTDGTAIGLAIAQAVNRLKDGEAASKVMIVLTDGVNNRGEIDPLTATQIASTFGIRVYTIGVGTRGEAPYPRQTPFGVRYQSVPVEVDEATLKEVAAMTDGKYFRATNNKALQDIYQEIDLLEKTRIEVRAYRSYTELFYSWALAGLIALLLELILSKTVLGRIP
ncbi:MAG: VWA domain-containing protein [Ignavibacteria bacterium]|nr:VWA domain-containing protein [Ignavibacteria bacterium]